MRNKSDLNAITSQFVTRCENMPRISTSFTNPDYTSLKNFQDKINANVLSIMSYIIELGHLTLTRTPEDFIAATNNVAFVAPVNPGNAPPHPQTMATRLLQLTRLRRKNHSGCSKIKNYNSIVTAIPVQPSKIAS